MSDLEPKRKLEHNEKALDSSAGQAFDAGTHSVEPAQVKAAENANPHQHSGSAGGDQEHSLEIVGFDAVASRKTKLTEQDIKETTLLEGRVEENTMSPQAVMEKIASLPLEKQAQVIGAGVSAYYHELDEQQYEIIVAGFTGISKGVNGLLGGALGLAKSVGDLAQFSIELAENKPIAQEKAAQAGEAFGKLLVGGIRVVDACDHYLGGLGAAAYAGDNTKALRDISWLGHEINKQWQAMTPAQQTELATQLGTETLGGMLLGAGIHKLSKSANLVEKLQELGTEASQMGGTTREKYAKFIGEMTEEMLSRRREARIQELARTGRDLAGKPFGGWPVINEVFDTPGAVKQLTKDSCVSACGERLSKGILKQADLIQKLGAPVDCRKLATELGPEWAGDYVNAYKDFDAVMSGGEWCATFFDRLSRGLPHAVTVEGVTEAGTIKIFDPWEASSYEMTRENFILYWNGGAVYRK